MKMMILAVVSLAVISGAGLSGCASISQDSCKAGNWDALGYTDGTRGVRRDKVASYADRCSKYGITLDTAQYLRGFNTGLPTYCTYERGYALGEGGSDYNQVCSGSLATDFAPGYDAGRAVYAIYQEHKTLVDTYQSLIDDGVGIETRLANEDLLPEDRKRLRKKLRRFERDADDIRIDIRAFERINDLPKHDLS